MLMGAEIPRRYARPSFQRGTVFYLLSHCVTVAFSESWLHLL